MIHCVLTAIYYLLPITTDINPPDVRNFIHAGLEFAYIEEFDSAQTYFDTIISLHPENPAGYFFKAALLQLKMMDQCQHAEEEEYFALMRRVVDRAESILAQEDNLWAEFYLANSYTYRAVYEGFKNNYLETFKYGMQGGRMLQGIVRKDSTFYDAYLGAGTFEYFWARAARYLPLLKLVGGNAEEAIRKVHVAADRGMYSGPTARNLLAFLYKEEKKFEQATEIIDSLLSEYPESKTFMWNKAELELKKKNYLAAIDMYTTLYTKYNNQNEKNYANIAQCKLAIGKCYYELEDRENARAALREVIALKQHADHYPQIKGYCREAYGLLSRIL
jgi:tetratricopeptide (TPR) repeat protein